VLQLPFLGTHYVSQKVQIQSVSNLLHFGRLYSKECKKHKFILNFKIPKKINCARFAEFFDLPVKWPFFWKSFRSYELSVKWPFSQMNFRSNDYFSKKAFGQMDFRSDVISVIWLLFQVRFSIKWPFSKYFRSNDLLINFVYDHMTFFGKMNFRSNGLRLNGDSVKWTFG
jgi:hypothetical protein